MLETSANLLQLLGRMAGAACEDEVPEPLDHSIRRETAHALYGFSRLIQGEEPLFKLFWRNAYPESQRICVQRRHTIPGNVVDLSRGRSRAGARTCSPHDDGI